MISNESSIDKIIDFILSSNSENVVVSHLLFRDIGGCDKRCGGCCKRVTLDYFEDSERWRLFCKTFPEKVIDFERVKILDGIFYVNLQTKNSTGYCQYLDRESGLCSIHIARPLLCQSTPLKFKRNPSRNRVLLTSETYGRKHAFKRIDGLRGAKCVMLDKTERRRLEDILLLEELVDIGRVLRLPVEKLSRIITMLENKDLTFNSFVV